MDILQEISFCLIQALQSLSPALDSLMSFFSFIGRIEFYLLLIPFIYWVVDSRLGFRTLLVLISIDSLGNYLKLLFHQPRPYWIGPVQGLAEETSYGIPSTHSSDSLAVWGYLAYRLRKTWLWVTAIALVLLIGISRLYLGVHFLHDVLFGWLIGGAVLWIFAKYEARVATWAGRQSTLAQVGAGFGLSLLIILVGQLIQALLAGIPDAQAWSAYATHARTASYSFTLAGTLFGSITGYALMKKRASFQCSGRWLKRIGRYLLGIIIVLLIYFGLDMLFAIVAADETAAGYALRYIRYATATFVLTFAAPWLFIKTGLAERTPG